MIQRRATKNDRVAHAERTTVYAHLQALGNIMLLSYRFVLPLVEFKLPFLENTNTENLKLSHVTFPAQDKNGQGTLSVCWCVLVTLCDNVP